MKQLWWCAMILFALGATATAQTKSKKNKKQAKPSKTVSAKQITTNKLTSSNIAILNSTANYSAKANANNLFVLKNDYAVTDPILTTLNARANGANIQFNKSGIVGTPKRAYGFANGHIVFNSSGSVTSGTQTGSGAVGTGSSLATFGSMGVPMNVNAKSQYAGINMWGNAMNMSITKSDSTVRLSPKKNNDPMMIKFHHEKLLQIQHSPNSKN